MSGLVGPSELTRGREKEKYFTRFFAYFPLNIWPIRWNTKL